MSDDAERVEPLVQELIGRLREPDWLARIHAAAALGSLRMSAVVVPELVKGLQDASAHVRKLAAFVLGELGPEARPAVPALTAALCDADEAVQRRAAAALGKLGADAVAALPALREAAGDPRDSVRALAALALVEIERQLTTKSAA